MTTGAERNLTVEILNWRPPGQAFYDDVYTRPDELGLWVKATLWMTPREYDALLAKFAPSMARSTSPLLPTDLREGLRAWVKSRDHYYVGYALTDETDKGAPPNADFESLLHFIQDRIDEKATKETA